jgi:hypothetical protein
MTPNKRSIMTLLRTLLAGLLIPFALHAQLLQHPLTAHPGDAARSPREQIQGTLHINVLAVMVQFQIDADQRTTGNGQFDTSHVTSGDVPVDAPPRNASYFGDHLTFLANYYAKASKGKLLITSTLIPQVITLPNVMSTYSPLKNGPTTPVALLARDTWRMADSLALVPAFTDYHAFVIFHAGAGHDIDLVSALGYDPADRDIPSLYLGESAFQAALGTPGVPVHGGAYVYNTLVLPETESRKIPGIGGDVFLEYGINGMLCASMGNFLGLPDLFDTKTGATAIGRFGLMDGQGLFSFNGVFPPEPSAWEKYWLGWIDPITLGNGSTTLQLPAVGIADTVYRVPIGPSEYYLVENRNRDPQRNGQTVTMRYDNTTSSRTFRRDTSGFNAFDVALLKGNVVDVEDLDWSLPGGVDDTTFYDGGVLIWHIDERVIAANAGTNSVNADAKHRGVDLEEADGSQDLGQTYGTFSAGSGSEIGTPLDFWFAGSNSPINKNEFSAATFPSTQSYDGGDSHVAMRNFSARGPRMTVRVTVGDSAVALLPGFPKLINQILPFPSLAVGPLTSTAQPAIVVSTLRDTVPGPRANAFYGLLGDARMYAWQANGQRAMPGGFLDGRIAQDIAQTAGFVPGPLLADLNGDGTPEILVGDNPASLHARALVPRDANADSLADELYKIDVTGTGTVAPAVSGNILLFGDAQGRIHLFGFDGGGIGELRPFHDSPAAVVGVGSYPSPYLGIATGSSGNVALFADPRLAGPLPADRNVNLGHAIAGPASVGDFGTSGVPAVRAAVAARDGFVYLLDQTLSPCPGFPVKAGEFINAPPALGDLNGDGLRDIVVFSGNRIFTYNASGVMLDGFPVALPTADSLSSAPVLGDVDGNGSVDIIGVTHGGLVVAVDGHGKPVRGFPLVAGQGAQTAAVFTSHDSVFLVVASSSTGSVSGWLTGRTSGQALASRYPWPQYQHDAGHSGVDLAAIAGVPLSNESFPKNRAYNWPNPVYDRTTQIRYYLKDDARVHIKIFDLAGDLVTEFDGPGVGGRDNETVWDVSGVQTGVYYAHIDASGPSTSGSVVIKIAVVR